MNRSGLGWLIVVGLCAVGGSAPAQVPVYLPPANSSPTTAPVATTPVPTPTNSAPVTFPVQVAPQPNYGAAAAAAPATVVDPSPVYPPAVPGTSSTPPIYEPAPNIPPASMQAPLYRPSGPNYSAPPMNTAPSYSPMPGYGGPQGMPFAQPNSTGGAMPYGSFDRNNFAGGPQTPPAPTSRWMPTYGAPFGGALQGGYGQAGACPPAGGCEVACDKCFPGCWYDNLSVISGIDTFKGPVDLDGLNGNFGKRVGLSAAAPVYAPWGLGVQFSGTAGWYDPKGTLYTGDEVRFQNFWTVGAFHRSCTNGLGFGIAYDWLYDDYWSNLRLGQWRVGGSWQVNAFNEVGFWAALPDRRDSTTATGVNERFQTLLQGNFYYRHVWDCGAWSTVYAGIAESPSDISAGTNDQVPLNDYIAMYANATYIWPSSGGNQGRQEEIWNLSVGIAIYPGTARRIATSQFRPFFNPADNGNFGVWRK